MALNWLQPGLDGKTAHKRLHGAEFKEELLPFATPVMAKRENKPAGGVMAARWLPGVWVGKAHGSNEHLVCMADGSGIKSARSVIVRDVPLSSDLLRLICVGPGSRRFSTVPDPDIVVSQPDPRPSAAARGPTRAWQITKEVWQ